MNDVAVRLVPYSRDFLDRSWDWLHDPEIKALTMTPDFDREGQRHFFESLPDRPDYRIWGVSLADGRPIGAAGIKNIDGQVGEYWGYIGEKDCWGQGLGAQMMAAVEDEARGLGLQSLYLTVTATNARAIALYRRSGYVSPDAASDPLVMTKALLP